MAIKFSQFVVETNKANVNYLVGWDGAENVQITPADLLGSYPSGSGATGQVAFFDSASSIGGDNDLFFDSANKRLGIGTTTPTEKLEIVGNIRIDSTSAAQLFLDSAAGNDSVINFQEGASQKAKMGYDNSLTGLAIVAGSGPYSTADMVILDGGNVGIGTTSPSAKLEVDGTLISTGISQLGSGGANVYLTSSSAGNVGIGTSGPVEKLQINSGDVLINNSTVSTLKSGGSLYIDLNTFGSYSGRNFRISDNGTSLVNVTQVGNVGIGTTSPGYKLDIEGDSSSGVVSVKNAANGRDTFRSENAAGTRTLNFGNDGSGHGLFIVRDSAGAVTNYITGSGNSYFNAGNVGIGTTSPLKKLSINGGNVAVNNGNSFIVGAAITGNTQIGELGADSGQLQLLTESTRDIKFGSTTYGNIMFLEGSNGNVGIGTASPGEKLEVNGNIKVIESGQTPDVSVFHSDGSYAKLRGQGLFLSRSTSYVAPVSDNFGSLAVGYNGARWGNVEINAATVKFQNGASEFMRIDSSGNVGIGTTSPSTLLQVSGAGNRAGGNIQMGLSSQGADKWSMLTGTHYNSTTEPEGFALIGGYSDIDENRVVIGGDIWETNPATSIHFWTHSSSTHAQGGSERMRIDSSGNVGIGDTSPTSISANTFSLSVNSSRTDLSGGLISKANGTVKHQQYWDTGGYNFSLSASSGNFKFTGGNVGIGTTSPASKLEVDGGDIEIDDSASGLILKSPDGTRYRVTVANGGTLSVAAV